MSSVQKFSAIGVAFVTYFAIGCTPQAPPTTIGVQKPVGGNSVTADNTTTGTTPTTTAPVEGQNPPPATGTSGRPAPPVGQQGAPQVGRPDAPPGPQPGGGQGQGQRGGGGGFGGRGASIAFLVNNDQIKKELAITPDQVKKIEAALPARGSVTPGGAGGGQQQTPEERQKERDELQKKVEAVLTPAQKTRIHEIQYQMSGVRAFSNPDVVKALAITADQTKKLEAIVPPRGQGGPGAPSGGGAAGAPAGPGGQGGGQQMSQEDRQKQRAEQMKKALDVLTPAQKAKWEKMKGKPFQLQLQQRGTGGPAGAPGGSRGG